jgi:hypothetical protein
MSCSINSAGKRNTSALNPEETDHSSFLYCVPEKRLMPQAILFRMPLDETLLLEE